MDDDANILNTKNKRTDKFNYNIVGNDIDEVHIETINAFADPEEISVKKNQKSNQINTKKKVSEFNIEYNNTINNDDKDEDVNIDNNYNDFFEVDEYIEKDINQVIIIVYMFY